MKRGNQALAHFKMLEWRAIHSIAVPDYPNNITGTLIN
jgi:hypothetical protein